MRCARVLLSLIPIPALIAGTADTLPRSVRKLLNKPRYGPARITFVDGRLARGTVLRVNTQFVTFRESRTSCENIDLTRIASIGVSTPAGDSFADAAGVIALAIFISPIWVPWGIADELKHSLSTRDPIIGNWQATSPHGTTDRIEFLEPFGVRRTQVIHGSGRYRVSDGNLYLSYDPDAAEETIPFRYDCDHLIMDRTSGPLAMRDSVAEHRAAEPIVGQWREGTNRHWSQWDFREDGMFRKKIVEEARQGTFGRDGDSLRIQWSLPRGLPIEEWKVRTKNHHLFVTIGDVTTEYERAPRKADVTAP